MNMGRGIKYPQDDWIDMDLGPQDLLLRFQCWHRSRLSRSAVEVSVFPYTYTRTTDVLWGKRDSVATLKRRAPLSTSATPSRREGQEPWGDQPLQVFETLNIKGPLYYTKVCFGWLSLQTQERKSLNTSKEGICNVNGWKGNVPYLEGLAQILGR